MPTFPRADGAPASRGLPERASVLAVTARLWSGQITAQLLTGIIFVVVARETDAGGLGRASACYGLAVASTQLVDLGAQRRLLRDGALDVLDPARTRSLLVGKPLLAVAVSPVPVAAMTAILHSPFAAAAVWLYAVVRARLMIAQSLWQLEGRAGRSAVVAATERAVALLAMLVLLRTGASAPAAVAGGLLAGALLMSIPAIPVYRRADDGQRVGRGDVPGALRFGRHYALLSLAANLLLLDTVIVTVVADDVQAGYFGIGARLLGPLLVVTTSLSTALIPASARQDVPLRRPFLLATAATLAVIAAVVASAPHLIRLAAGAEYVDATSAVRMYAVASAFVALAQPLAAWLQARGDEQWVGRVVPISIMGGLVGVAVGAGLGGATGAAAGQAIAIAVATAVLIRRAALIRHRQRGSRARTGSAEAGATA